MNKRIVALLAILVLVFPLLAACEGRGGGSQTGNSLPTPVDAVDGGTDAEPTTDTGGTGTESGIIPAAGVARAGAAPTKETAGTDATTTLVASTEGALATWANSARVKALQPLIG